MQSVVLMSERHLYSFDWLLEGVHVTREYLFNHVMMMFTGDGGLMTDLIG